MLCSSVLKIPNQAYWMSSMFNAISHLALHLCRADLGIEILWNQWEVGSWISSVPLRSMTKNWSFVSFSVCFLSVWTNKDKKQSVVPFNLLIKYIQTFSFQFMYKLHDLSDFLDHLNLRSALHITLGITYILHFSL